MNAGPGGKVAVVLGGAGGMGRHAALAAVKLTGVERVRIADRDRAAAERAAAACGPRAEALELDVVDDVALRAALGEADLVLNTVGPYFRFGPPLLRAAIESGCDYLDLCDDPDPTVAMLDLSVAAARAGVRAVIGMGASPGVVNLLAVVAMRELDDAHRVVTGWNGEGATPEPGSGPAAIEHGIAQATGTIPVVRDGAERRERPLRRVAIDYPGLGRRRARTFGHPEPLTLHWAFGVAESLNLTHGRRRFVVPLLALARLCDRGLLPVRRAVNLVDFTERQMPSPPLGALASPRRPCSPWPRACGTGPPPRWGSRWGRCRERAWGRSPEFRSPSRRASSATAPRSLPALTRPRKRSTRTSSSPPLPPIVRARRPLRR